MALVRMNNSAASMRTTQQWHAGYKPDTARTYNETTCV